MKIAITVDPYIPVPPVEYGGIERVVDFVARGLVARGHEVTLFAHPDSQTAGELVPYGTPPHWGAYARTRELADLMLGLWQRRDDVDVVLSWGRLAALAPILLRRKLPKIQRYCRGSVPWGSVAKASTLAGQSILFAGASTSVYNSAAGSMREKWRTVFDGVELDRFDLVTSVGSDAPLVFLGRLERIKGVHSAIAIAQMSGRRLIIAGNRVNDATDPDYFEKMVEPHLGESISWIGPVDDKAKNSLLGSAAALLMPIEWQEAFGIVMAEAFACGTPVIGFARGSVPEIVRHGVNGFVCTTVAEASGFVSRLGEIDRRAARDDCAERFGSEKIVDAYESIMSQMVARRGS